MTEAQRLARDISPRFTEPTEYSSRVGCGLIARQDTPQGITYFAKHCGRLDAYSYWFMLGVSWVQYTGFSDLKLWKRLFAANVPDREECLMKPSELRLFRALPETFNAYRAHRDGEPDWIAYTLDPAIAGRECVKRNGTVKLWRIKRSDCIALFVRRQESEIIMLDKSRAQYVTDVSVITTP